MTFEFTNSPGRHLTSTDGPVDVTVRQNLIGIYEITWIKGDNQVGPSGFCGAIQMNEEDAVATVVALIKALPPHLDINQAVFEATTRRGI